MPNSKAQQLAKQLELDIAAYVDRCMAAARLVGGQEPLKLQVAVLAAYTTAAAIADQYPNPSVSRLAWESLASYWFGKWEALEKEAAARKAATTAGLAASNPHGNAPVPQPVGHGTAATPDSRPAKSGGRPRGSGTPAGQRPTP